MEQTQQPAWLKGALTLAYALGIALLSFYVGLRLDRWIFLTFRWDMHDLLCLLMFSFFLMHMITGPKYLVAKGRLRTYLCGVSTFLMIWLGIGFLAADLWGRFTYRHSLDYFRSSGWVVVLATVLLAVLSFHHRKVIALHEESFPLTEGPCRVIFISDLHIGYYVAMKHIQRIVDRINLLDPDYVLIGGDLINAGNTNECRQLREVEALLRCIKAPTYAVTGNHDPAPDDPDFRRFLQISGIQLLEDEVLDTPAFHLVGRSTCTRPRKELSQLLPERTAPVIVLDHDPQGLDEAVEAHADLLLCGHTHRGQVFPLNLFVRAVYSKAQTGGRAKTEDTWSYVTSGAGYFSMPMRLGSTCEMVCLELGKPEAPQPPADEEPAPSAETTQV